MLTKESVKIDSSSTKFIENVKKGCIIYAKYITTVRLNIAGDDVECAPEEEIDPVITEVCKDAFYKQTSKDADKLVKLCRMSKKVYKLIKEFYHCEFCYAMPAFYIGSDEDKHFDFNYVAVMEEYVPFKVIKY